MKKRIMERARFIPDIEGIKSLGMPGETIRIDIFVEAMKDLVKRKLFKMTRNAHGEIYWRVKHDTDMD